MMSRTHLASMRWSAAGVHVGARVSLQAVSCARRGEGRPAWPLAIRERPRDFLRPQSNSVVAVQSLSCVPLEWVDISSSGGSSSPRDWTCISCVSCIGRWIFFFFFFRWTKKCNKLGHLWLREDYSRSCSSPLIGHFMNYLGDDLAGHFMNPSSGGLAVRANIVRWKRKLLLHSFTWATVPWAYPLRGPGQQRILAKDTLGPNRTTHSYSATNQVCDWASHEGLTSTHKKILSTA